MKRSLRVLALLILLTFVSGSFGGFANAVPVKAAESEVKFEKSKLTLRTGNRYQTQATGIQYEEWGYYGIYYYADFYSSDTSVATINSYGIITAIAPGTCTITVQDWYGKGKATMKVTVKEGTTKFSKSEVRIYSGQSVEVTLKNDKNASYYNYDYVRTDDVYRDGGLSVNSSYDGVFTIQGTKSGTYRFTGTVVDTDGQYWSDSCIVNVIPCGPDYKDKALAVGTSFTLPEGECTLKEVYIPEVEETYWYNTSGYYNDHYYSFPASYKQDCISVNNGKITANSEGSAFMLLIYATPEGDEIFRELTIRVTDPKIKEDVPAYMLSSRYYYRDDFIEGTSSYSECTITSSDTSVVSDPGTGNYLYVVGTGEVKLTFTVDGKKLSVKTQCYDPQISTESMLLKKSKTKTLKVTGIPDGLTPKFKSGSKKVATVSSSGKVTAKGYGYTEITVTCGSDISFIVGVNVARGKAVDAVLQGEKLIGWKYSQDLRMKDGYADCSAFVWKAYHKAGVDLKNSSYAPTAADLAKYMDEQGKTLAYEYIDPSELQPGDLIFYGGSSNGRYKNINHVAMYYGVSSYIGWWGEKEVDGIIIHATSPSVHKTSYSGYIPGAIVLIARPLK